MRQETFSKEFERLTGYYGKIAKNDDVNKQRAFEFYKKFSDIKDVDFVKTIDLWIETEQWFPTPQALYEKGNFRKSESELKSCNFETPIRKNKPCRKGLVFAWDDIKKKEETFICPNPHCQAGKQYTKGTFKKYPMKQVGLHVWEDWQDIEFESLPIEKQEKINRFVKKIMAKQSAKEQLSAFVKNIGKIE